MPQLQLLNQPTRYLFFTGKGGVGKTSLSTACALALADAGKQVLLVSTDSASNLDEMLGITLANTPVPVPGAPSLSVLNIDPNAAAAAEDYHLRVLAQMDGSSTDDDRAQVREQLSGSCTTEIASFDEFASLLSGAGQDYDHVVFDTAPTGHTLRLLSLPQAWTGFLADNDRGASCLGPHSGLKMQEQRFALALHTLSDPAQTTVVLVTRPEHGAMAEAARTSAELIGLGLGNQRLAINGVFHASVADDPVATAFEATGVAALRDMPAALQKLAQDQIPLRAFDTVGLPALRALLGAAPVHPAAVLDVPTYPGLAALADALSQAGHGLIMVMGKGGVGKTTVAAARIRRQIHGAPGDASDATARPGAHPNHCGDAARSHPGVASRRPARRLAPCPDRALCLGHQPQHAGRWQPRPAAGCASGRRAKADAAHCQRPVAPKFCGALAGRAAGGLKGPWCIDGLHGWRYDFNSCSRTIHGLNNRFSTSNDDFLSWLLQAGSCIK